MNLFVLLLLTSPVLSKHVVSQEMNDHITSTTSSWTPIPVEDNPFNGVSKKGLLNKLGHKNQSPSSIS